MKRTTIALLALVSLFGAAAQADGLPYQSFFTALEGQWDGNGVLRQLNPDGSEQSVKYEMQLQLDRASDAGTWTTSSHVTTESGTTTQNTVDYTVHGDVLLVGSGGAAEPVQVTTITPRNLTYKYQRVDVVTGRSYSFTFHVEIDASGANLLGHNTVETNGVMIEDETFTAKKW